MSNLSAPRTAASLCWLGNELAGAVSAVAGAHPNEYPAACELGTAAVCDPRVQLIRSESCSIPLSASIKQREKRNQIRHRYPEGLHSLALPHSAGLSFSTVSCSINVTQLPASQPDRCHTLTSPFMKLLFSRDCKNQITAFQLLTINSSTSGILWLIRC